MNSIIFKIPFCSSPPLYSSLGSPMVLLCNSAQAKRKCFCMASRAHFSFRTPAAHTSQYTNMGIFLSSVSSRCWMLLFCLMKTAPLFVSCLMFQEASHFQVLLVISTSMLMDARTRRAVVLQVRTHTLFKIKCAIAGTSTRRPHILLARLSPLSDLFLLFRMERCLPASLLYKLMYQWECVLCFKLKTQAHQCEGENSKIKEGHFTLAFLPH